MLSLLNLLTHSPLHPPLSLSPFSSLLAGSGGAAFYANTTRGATVKADLGGVSSVALFNNPKEVDVLLSGASAVDAYTAPGAVIRGAALGANSVNFQGGACEVTGPFGLGSPCARGPLADVAIVPLWSCGLRADGPFTCPKPEANGGAAGIQAAAAPGAAPGALSAQPLAQAAPIMAAPAPAVGGMPAAPAPASAPSDLASGGRRLAQAASAVGGRFRDIDRPVLPTLTNFAGSRVAILPCVEAPLDLVVGMDGTTGQ